MYSLKLIVELAEGKGEFIVKINNRTINGSLTDVTFIIISYNLLFYIINK